MCLLETLNGIFGNDSGDNLCLYLVHIYCSKLSQFLLCYKAMQGIVEHSRTGYFRRGELLVCGQQVRAVQCAGRQEGTGATRLHGTTDLRHGKRSLFTGNAEE